MGAGRPSLLTPELLATVSELADRGLPLDMIADAINVNRKTCARWVREVDNGDDSELKKQFRALILKAEQNLAASLVGSVRQAAVDGDSRAATWMLTHHPAMRDTWSDAAATRREVQAVLQTVVQTIQASDLTPEQQDHLLLRMQAAGLGAAAS